MEESFLDRMTRWMSHDVKICIAHDAYIGAMNLMMSHVSAMSSFYSGRTTGKVNDHDEFMNFYRKYFRAFPDIQQPRKEKNGRSKHMSIIYTHFRCGLIHEHLMKTGTALDRGLSKPGFYIEKKSGMIVLNIDHFFFDYLRVLATYNNQLKYGDDEKLKQNFIRRAKFLGAEEPII